jgi:hypothetical protein
MIYVLASYEVEDFDRWKERFDADPFEREKTAIGHQLLRSTEDPNVVFVRVEFDSVIAAMAFRDRLRDAAPPGARMAPAVVELSDSQVYDQSG